MMILKFAKLNSNDEDIKIPTKRYEDAGYDIYPHFDSDFKRIRPHKTVMIPTGIASVIPEGYYMQLEEKGSTGSLGIKRSAGVIDSGYRGEWFVAITNTNDVDLYIAKKSVVPRLDDAAYVLQTDIIIYPYEKAIAQAILHKVPDVVTVNCDYEEVKNTASERGTGKLGSTDAE